MAQTSTEPSKGASVSKTLVSISFHNKKPADQPLISEANEFLKKPENEGLAGTSVLRKFFKRVLAAANAGQLQIQDNSSPRIAG